jgi:YgiT-type zinc finger domain-containing protein
MNICPFCRIGRLGKRSMVYLEWHGKNLLIANRMPALVCDVCGERVYDDAAIESLQRLLWARLPNPTTVIPTRNS